MTSQIDVDAAAKPCESNFNSLFTCLTKQENTNKGDFNQCRSFYSDLKKCNDEAVTEKEKEEVQDTIDKSLSGALQAALPRVFKNAEDLPRERTILADTLAKVAPQIFDPKDDDDDD